VKAEVVIAKKRKNKASAAAAELGRLGALALQRKYSKEEIAEMGRRAAKKRLAGHVYAMTPGAVYQRLRRARIKNEQNGTQEGNGTQ
jgi:hypothetical protein